MSDLVADKLVVFSTDPSFTEAVEMDGANAIFIHAQLFSFTSGAQVRVQAQQSNDLENWAGMTPTFSLSNLRVQTASITKIGGRYVRLRFAFTSGSGTAVAASEFEVKQL